jgi:hypothetical protein
MMRGSDDLGVSPRKSLGVALSARTPRSFLAAGYPLQSLTRGSRLLIAFLLGAVGMFSGCSSDTGSSTEMNGDPVEEANATVGNSCDDLPTSFASYTEAMDRIRSASFRMAEEQNTDESSWVRGAEYYSCDGASGFFIIRTDDREYIHFDVPVAVWQGFKDASSFGTYYNANIKRRYRLGLN